MEAIISEQRGASNRGSVATVEARFRGKLSGAGHNGSPVPVEMPMATSCGKALDARFIQFSVSVGSALRNTTPLTKPSFARVAAYVMIDRVKPSDGRVIS